VRSWWISEPKEAEKLLTKAAAKIRYAQRRNEQARRSHTKTTLRKLKKLGIDLAEIERCQWDEASLELDERDET